DARLAARGGQGADRRVRRPGRGRPARAGLRRVRPPSAQPRRGARRRGLVIRALLIALVALAVAAPAASAHATLEGTTPARGAELKQAPDAVTFRFSESVEANF